MKIEILEQGFASYLRNCEGCLISQTNWRVTPKMMSTLSAASLKEVEKIVDEIKSQTNLNLFKKNKTQQFISQCEIDIVGLKSDKSGLEIYLFDTAFHEKGLNYKDTPASVCKKLVRAFIIGKLFFDGYRVHVGFVSPKCNHSQLKKIYSNLPIIDQILQKYSSSITIETYLNDDCSNLINDLVALAPDISDDGDLFIRSIKLLNLSNKPTTTKKSAPVPQQSTQTKQDNRTIVYNVLDILINNNKLTPQLIADLSDLRFSKTTFSLSGYPFMIEANQIPQKDHGRYYARCFVVNGKVYRVCSQWYPESIAALKEWFKTI
jgi:hypothetical protein